MTGGRASRWLSWIALLMVVTIGPLELGAQASDSKAADEDSLFGSPDESGASNQDSLFDGDEEGLFQAAVVQDVVASAPLARLVDPAIQLGGRYSFSLAQTWRWSPPLEEIAWPDEESFSSTLNATVFFDARPGDDFRVFLKSHVSHPFTLNDGDGRDFTDIIQITELFSDFQIGDRLFMRGGKHQLSWGVGYFFSPADVLNVTAIDPEDPGADREGPVSLKVNLPLGVNNLYLYLVSDRAAGTPQLGVGPKAEFVLGGTEIGAGGYWHPERPPTGMITVSSSLGKTALFAEGVLQYGTDRRYVEDVAGSPGVVEREAALIPSATVGAQRSFSGPDNDWQLSAALQYLYNGEGYDGDELIYLKDNQNEAYEFVGNGALLPQDLVQVARNYAAGSFFWGSIASSDFSASVFWTSSLADFSGRFAPGLTWTPDDHFNLGLSLALTYGEEGAEFTPGGATLAISLSASAGSGRF